MKLQKMTLTLALMGIGVFSFAQETSASKWGFGFQLSEWGNDFGVGGHVTSPFLFDVFAIDLGYQQKFNSDYLLPEHAWDPYGIIDIGVRSKAGQITPWFHMYGFGRMGILAVTPDSWDASTISGSGGFGFEFNTHNSGFSPVSYYIELGGRGGLDTGLNGEPSTAGGFQVSTGFRMYF